MALKNKLQMTVRKEIQIIQKVIKKQMRILCQLTSCFPKFVQHAHLIQTHHQIMKMIQRKKVIVKITVWWPRRLPKMEIKESEISESEISESEKEDLNRKFDIKYATKNKTTKKKIGKDREDSLIVKTLTITKRKRKIFQFMESGCDKVFDEIKEWTKHMNDEHKLEEYCCTVCRHRTKRKEKYEKHMLVHEEKKNKWKCNVCSKAFTHKCYLKRHELNHTDEKKYKCTDPACRKKGAGKFKHKADFIRHMERHKGNKYKCSSCRSVWPSKKDRYEHERMVHRQLKKCRNQNCHYVSKDPKMLLKHETNCKK